MKTKICHSNNENNCYRFYGKFYSTNTKVIYLAPCEGQNETVTTWLSLIQQFVKLMLDVKN